ncbi:MAG: DUF6272 family protein [Bacteroidota bacterium]
MEEKKIYSFSSDVIDYDSVNEALTSISNLVDTMHFPPQLQRSLYMISAECFDNMYKHSQQVLSDFPVFFEIFYCCDKIRLVSSNPVSTKSAQKIQTYLRFLNYLSDEELKAHYLTTIKTEKKTKKGGAGLGLLILKRKTNCPFEYNFEQKSKKTTIFTLELKLYLQNMKLYRISQTEHTPLIQFDFKHEKIVMFGQSRPEDADGFYIDVCDWITKNESDFATMKHPVLHVDLDYYNSSSLKNLVRFIRVIIQHTAPSLKIEWTCDADDELALDDAQEISRIVKKKFVLLEK